MTAAELAAQVRAELAARVDAPFREGVIRFFREPVDPWGVRSKDVQQIVSMATREARRWPRDELNRFANLLWKSGKIEEGVVATGVYRRFARQCGESEFRLFERWIDRQISNWANCDGVSTWLVAASVANEPRLIGELRGWTQSGNRWKRRASIVSLLQEAKKGRNLEAVFEIAGTLLDDPDDMVQKGVGWVLKEAYPPAPKRVVAFLTPRKERAPRLVLRLAAEKMSPADRKTILS